MNPVSAFDRIKTWRDTMPEECGVFGIFDPEENAVASLTYYGLYALQHRGQESAGIAVSDGRRIRCHKEMGLVPECFDPDILTSLGSGHIAVGHVRYSTTGDSSMINCQPLVVHLRGGSMALAHNGNLINSQAVRTVLEEQGHISQTSLDTEVIAALLARSTADNLQTSIENMMGIIRGSYALTICTNDQLIGVRDPHGIRPLVLGQCANGAYVLASETCALDAVGADLIRDIAPGEIVMIDKEGVRSCFVPAQSSKLCIFEFVYFARTDSHMDGVSIYKAREMAGRLLAGKCPVDADVVAGVPDSAIPAAIGYASESGIPYGEVLAKNRYVGRTFIQPVQAMREEGVRIKLNAVRQNVWGKRIILVDDSIVRGTTSRKIVDMLRAAGAKEVHLRIMSPPVRFSCYFGIDTPTGDELIGSTHSVDEICKVIGADSLAYLSQEDLLRTVDGAHCGFCRACFDGEYPMDMLSGSKHDQRSCCSCK